MSRYLYERNRTQQFVNNRHSLSQRYQLSENVRSVQMLNPLIIFLSLTSIGTTVVWNFNQHLTAEWRPIGVEIFYMLRILQVHNLLK
jgi:hypothetical protein